MPSPDPPEVRVVFRRLVLPLLAAVLLAGCGVATSPAQVAPARYVEDPLVRGGAEEVFGADRVAAAWEEVSAFTLRESFREDLIDPQRTTYTRRDLTVGVVERMTAAAAQAWMAQVDAALGGDAAAQDAVRLLRFYDIEAPASRLPAAGEVVTKQHLTEGEIRLLPGTEAVPDRLEVSCRLDATLRYVEDGVSYEIRAVKPLTYRLRPAPAGYGPSWLIAEYDGSLELKVVP
ncbi:hypothetical protein [Georgenia thermotolerans]|uniref:Uncharacterized protein n=1 Tax=Georgenia thermotolerans TaxID=527326 RepID=A0A7J5UU63_9MICO|nr:hypothetical protein [Georgenia thermotolerans]KAE8765817.1 hypothetical protein GB883_01800 [Georgenia thermotolerans]